MLLLKSFIQEKPCFLISIPVSLFLLLTPKVQSERNYEINLTKFNCKIHNQSIFENMTCYLTEENNKTYGYALIRMREKFNNIPVRIQLIQLRLNRPQWTFYDVKLDFCGILSAGDKHKIFRSSHKEIRRSFGEMPNCPTKANYTYIMKRYYVDPEDYPSNLPAGKYRVNIYFFKNDNKIGESIFEMKVLYNLTVKRSKKPMFKLIKAEIL